MINPRDEFEAELYRESAVPSGLPLWYFLALSIVFFGLGTATLVAPSVTGPGSTATDTWIPLGSLLVFTGASLLAGWLLGTLFAIGTRVACWID